MNIILKKYKQSKTLLQYLIYAIIIKMVYFFKRDLLHRHIELIEVKIASKQLININAVKEKLTKHVYEYQNQGSRRHGLSLIVINDLNYSYSDDLILWFKELDPNASLFIQPTFSLFELNQPKGLQKTKLLYDIQLFLASQASLKSNDLSMRLYYSRVLKRLAETENQKGIVQDDSVRLFFNFYIPSICDIFDLAKSALSGKLIHYTLSIPFGTYNDNDRNKVNNPVEVRPRDWKNVIITGWYGTETSGDKAILGELVHFIKTYSPDCRITITSICPMVSYQTIKELANLSDAKIIELTKAASSSVISETDSVIIGGGPLMDSSLLKYIYSLFAEANKHNKLRIIFGCGIGPIKKEETRVIVKKILELTTAGFLRDKESHDYATRLYPKHVLKWACDPAFGYITRWRKNAAVFKENNNQIKIAGLLRANTREFRNELDNEQLEKSNEIAASQIAAIVEPVCYDKNAIFELLHMNAPWLGGDDRIFNRKIERSFKEANRVNVVREYLTLEELLQKLSSADVSVAMRYHGHIFSMALGIPFLSINYTGKKGKVYSLVTRINYTEYYEEWGNINDERASIKLQELLSRRKALGDYLLKETQKLVYRLYSIYTDVFRVTITPY